jgi:hypothetical protein
MSKDMVSITVVKDNEVKFDLDINIPDEVTPDESTEAFLAIFKKVLPDKNIESQTLIIGRQSDILAIFSFLASELDKNVFLRAGTTAVDFLRDTKSYDDFKRDKEKVDELR